MYKIIENEVNVGCDIDLTLVRRANSNDINNTIKITNPNDNSIHYYVIHNQHVELLKQYKGRGFNIIAWSNNGVRWVQAVVDALGLKDTVSLIMTKPLKHMDDKTNTESVVGARVYIPDPELGFDF
jgi:hypothetical protein